MNNDLIELDTLSDRLNYSLKITKIRKADLARAIGVKPQVIQFLCNKKTISSKFTFEIAKTLGLNPQWLATGEGIPFISDDPKQLILKDFLKVPLLNQEDCKCFFIKNEKINKDLAKDWFPLKTHHKELYAIKMLDISMEPTIKSNSILFIKILHSIDLNENDYYFCYLNKLDIFLIRKIKKIDSAYFLVPENNLLFNKIELNDSVSMLGTVTDYYLHIKD